VQAVDSVERIDRCSRRFDRTNFGLPIARCRFPPTSFAIMKHPASAPDSSSVSSGDGAAPRPRRNSSTLAIATFLWLLAVVGGAVALAAYSNAPGDAGAPPAHWPKASGIPLDPGKPTLVFLAHPRCPCTRASLAELELLMAEARGVVSAHVVFIRPRGTEETWSETDLWRAAAAIPGVTMHRDDSGVETRRFGSETSGETLLYESDGHLVFQGGITIARGHAGDNPGRDTLIALLRHGTARRHETPVFGCPLFGAGPQPGGVKCE
jgi:hypothetical protein